MQIFITTTILVSSLMGHTQLELPDSLHYIQIRHASISELECYETKTIFKNGRYQERTIGKIQCELTK